MQRVWVLLFGVLIYLNVLGQNDFTIKLLPDTFDTHKPLHFIHLSANYLQEEKLEEAKAIIDFGFENISKAANEYYWAALKYNLADFYFYNQNYDSAKSCYLDIIDIFETFHDTLMLCQTFNSIGIIYTYETDYQNTIKYLTKAIELINQNKSNNPEIINQKLKVMNNLINHYLDKKDYSRAIEEGQKATIIATELNDSSQLASIYNGLAIAYKSNSEFEKSLEIYKSASEIYNSINDEFHNAFILNNIGNLYESLGKYDSAQYYIKEALIKFENEGFQYGIVKSKSSLASIYLYTNKIDESRKLYNEVIETALKYNFNDVLLLSYYEKGQLEYNEGNYKEAYKLNEKHHILSDSLFTIESQLQYADLQIKYETSKKENEINLLINERLKHENDLNKNKLYKDIALSLIIFLLILIYIIFLFYKQKINANNLLISKNKQIEFQNQQLILSNNYRTNLNEKLKQSRSELIKSNNSKNRFFSILAHDLRNPFHNILGQSYLLSKQFNNLNNSEKQSFSDDIYNSCLQVDRLLENLLEWSRTQTNEIEFSPAEIDIYNIITDTLAVLKENAQQKNIAINNYVEKPIIIKADRAMMETVFRNLINNSIKFTPNGGTISINCKIIKNNFYACVEDNGIGINKQNINKLFHLDSKFKTKGTNNENGTGLGLVICKEFINYHKGKIWAESEPGISTKFQFEIPSS